MFPSFVSNNSDRKPTKQTWSSFESSTVVSTTKTKTVVICKLDMNKKEHFLPSFGWGHHLKKKQDSKTTTCNFAKVAMTTVARRRRCSSCGIGFFSLPKIRRNSHSWNVEYRWVFFWGQTFEKALLVGWKPFLFLFIVTFWSSKRRQVDEGSEKTSIRSPARQCSSGWFT